MGSKTTKGQRFLIAVTIIGLMALIAAASISSAQKKSLDTKIAAAKKVGYPFEGKDLVPTFDYPESENAAPIYESANKLLAETKFTDKPAAEKVLQAVRERGLDKQELAALATYFSEFEPALDVFMAASRKPYCYFEKDWDQGASVSFPEYSSIRVFTKALSARALLRARAGDLAGAQHDLVAVLRSSEHMRQEPVLIALLVSQGTDAIVTSTVEALLTSALADESLAASMTAVLEQLPEKWDLTGPLRAEAFFSWWVAENADRLQEISGMDNGIDEGASMQYRLLAKTQFVARAAKTAILDVYTPFLRDYKPSSDEREVLRALEQRSRLAAQGSTLAAPVLSVIMPVYEGVSGALDRSRARKRSLLASMDVLAFHRANGRWPATLIEAGSDYTDPFDDKPLRYKLDGEGFRVWSVGQNGKDDGGKTNREKRGLDFDEVVVFDPSKTAGKK